MKAEQAYLFRHALVRDAAYGLQLPAERAGLHKLALQIIEEVHPEHELKVFAAELAQHARSAMYAGDDPALRNSLLKYTWLAATFAREHYANEAAVRWLDEAASLEPEIVRRAEALQLAANLLLATGRADEGRPRMHAALALARESGDGKLEGSMLCTLAGIEQNRGHFKETKALLNEALELARKHGDLMVQGICVANLASLMRHKGMEEEAFSMQQEALEIHRSAGNKRGEGMSLGNLSMYLLERGRVDEALQCCRDAIEANREAGNRRSEGIALGNLAMILADGEKLQQAAESYLAALRVDREVGNRSYEAWHLCAYALILLRQGDANHARDVWREGLELMRLYGDGPDVGITLTSMRKACDAAGVAPFDAA